MKASKKSLLIVFTTLFISFILFFPSFQLSLFGDDWLTFWRYLATLGPNSSGEWNHISYFLTSYGPQDILMGFLQNIYGYESKYYYLTSYLLRILAAFSLFPLMIYLTGKKSAAYFSSAFFLITTTGIETTNWVFNMPSYISIFFLNLFFYYLFISHSDQRKMIAAAIFFTLTLIIQPIRMHGLLPTVYLIELFWVIRNRNINTFKSSSLRLSLFSVITFSFIFIGLSKSPVATPENLLTQIFNPISQPLVNGDFSFLFNPLITLGSLIIPSDVLSLFFNTPLKAFMLGIIGLSLIMGSIILLLRSFKNINFSNAIFLSLIWSISSFFLAWWREPYSFFPTSHRYLIVSAVGISILCGALISIKKSSGLKTITSLLVFSLFILHFFASRDYLNKAYLSHNQILSQKIWSMIPYIPEVGKSNEPLIFYFSGDSSNEAILHDVIIFGFPSHIGLLYNTFEENKLPITLDSTKEVVSAVIDGKSISAYNRPAGTASIERIYAFQLQGNEKVINITEIVRGQLIEIQK